VGRTLYSVPWRLIGKRLDVRATATMVEFYLDGELVKTHVLQPRGRRTDWADLPEHKTGSVRASNHGATKWTNGHQKMTWSNKTPGQDGCAARDSNPEPAD
jgi:hypothetical protein